MISVENYFKELLHINEATTNKLIDLYASGGKNLYLLYSKDKTSYFSQSLLSDILDVYGSKGYILLRNSALNKEQIIGLKNRIIDWTTPNNLPSTSELDKFIESAYKELRNKGNNPIFLSVGAVKWNYAISATEVKAVETPLIIFPIRLNRISATSPVHIEFVEDEVYINPCLVSALEQTLDSSIVKNFPHPNGVGVDFDTAINLDKLQDGNAYFEKLEQYFNKIQSESEGNFLFEFLEDKCAISLYNHNEICMYYDIKRNKEKILNNELVKKAFSVSNTAIAETPIKKGFKSTQPYDTIQDNIIKRAINGESMVIKGPPGTGKTLTISNMVGGLLAENKKILLVSKKLAALSEVYAKVDPTLRKFLLLLESESEAEAAKINSNSILKDLKEILNDRKNYKFDEKNKSALEVAQRAISANILALDKYYKILFDKNKGLEELIKNVNQKAISDLGLELPETYYEILNNYYRHPEMPNINFITPAESLQIKKDVYNELYADVKDANTYYDLLTFDRTIKLVNNPWYGCLVFGNDNFNNISSNLISEEIFANFNTIKQSTDNVINILNDIFGDLNISNLMLRILHWILECNLSKEQIEIVLSIDEFTELKKLIFDAIYSITSLLNYASVDNYKVSNEQLVEHYIELSKLSVDQELTYSELKLIADNLELFGEGEIKLDNKIISKIIEVMNLIAKNENVIEVNKRLAYAIFKKDLTEKELKLIYSFYEKISTKEELKLSFLDFSLNSLYKKVSQMSYLGTVSLEEVFESSKAICEIKKVSDENRMLVREISKIFRRELSDKDVSVIKLVCDRSNKKQVALEKYVETLSASIDVVNKAFEMVNVTSQIKLENLFKHFELAYELNRAKGILNTQNLPFDGDVFSLIKSIFAVLTLKEEIGVSKENISELENIFAKLRENKELIITNVRTIFATINEVNKYFKDNIYLNNENIKSSELDFFVKHCNDKEILSNYINYNNIKYKGYKCGNELQLIAGQFLVLSEIEDGIKDYPLNLVFEHSYYNAMISMVELLLPTDMKNNIGNYNEIKLNNCLEGFKNLEQANVYDIEKTLMQTIDLTDPLYSPLLNMDRTNISLRAFFKHYAEAILKLKKAILISPSTVSLLFRGEEYSDFDVVIIDEASQMTPVSLLPILFRTKQVIVVGDEYQMPPIRNFVRKSVDNVYVDVDEVMMPADSALNLVLGSNSFKSYQLLCHYRSQTETLIQYSNEKHYTHMRTFPSPIPKAHDLGFKDYYIEGAKGGGGRNSLEAAKCVELIVDHFVKYYDHKNKVLKESLGIIAFGENQVNEITKILKKQEYNELSTMIDYARKNEPSGIMDKAFFLKTIETVQGQEADHIILSFTYGVDEAGKTSSSFGQLSKAKIGECIFNVAVTRAKKSIAVIHSFKGIEMKEGLNASFIADYLRISEKYSESEESSFEGIKPDLGFINDVRNYIISLGIPEDRVICDCGSNKGSVRIPIAILSRDKTRAICGIWTEKAPVGGYNYLDYNGRYYNILKDYGWNLYKLFIHDWHINNEAEKTKLKEYILGFNKK